MITTLLMGAYIALCIFFSVVVCLTLWLLTAPFFYKHWGVQD